MNGYYFVDSGSLAWRDSTFVDRVQVKDLGTTNGRSMQLVRYEPGASFPLHTHEGPEFIYLLEGEAFQQGQRLLPGWAAIAATGTVDENFHSPKGCLFLTVYSE
jgi:anti-sigma factor ChrR (cupin superfamily)